MKASTHSPRQGPASLLLAPLVLFAHLLLFARSEVVLDVESLPDFFGRLAFDHVGDRFARNVQETLDVEIVGSLHRQSTTPSVTKVTTENEL